MTERDCEMHFSKITKLTSAEAVYKILYESFGMCFLFVCGSCFVPELSEVAHSEHLHQTSGAIDYDKLSHLR